MQDSEVGGTHRKKVAFEREKLVSELEKYDFGQNFDIKISNVDENSYFLTLKTKDKGFLNRTFFNNNSPIKEVVNHPYFRTMFINYDFDHIQFMFSLSIH